MSDRVSNLKKLLLDRIPSVKQILGVYAVIVFGVYSWTLFVSFYNLPSWMFYLSAGQIASIYAYAFLASLADSLLMLAGVVLADYLLFFMLRDMTEFQSRAIVIAAAALLCSVIRLYLFSGYEDSAEFISSEFKWWAIAAAVGLPLAVLFSKVGRLRGFIEGFSERTSLFLYFYLALSGVSLAIVLVRNLS